MIVDRMLNGLKIFSWWSCIIFVISILFVVLAIFMFFVYYETTMPGVFTAAQPLYFDYEHPSDLEPLIDEDINIHYHISSNDFIIPKQNRHTVPTALFYIPDKLLSTRAAYSFTIHFKFADSPLNRQIGMFMVRMRMLNQDKEVLYTSNRPTMIPYKTGIHSFVKNIFLLIPSLLGLYEESYELTIPCVDYFWDDYSNPLDSVEITLSHPDIQLYSSTLFIGTQLFGLEYALHHYFLATSIFCIFIIFSIEWCGLVFIIIFYYLRYYEPSKEEVKLKRPKYPVPLSKQYEVVRQSNTYRESSFPELGSDKLQKETGLPISRIEIGDEEVTIESSSEEENEKTLIETNINSKNESISSEEDTPSDDTVIIAHGNTKEQRPLRKRHYEKVNTKPTVNLDELNLTKKK